MHKARANEPASVSVTALSRSLIRIPRRGIEATCGFGVAYRGLHGADERVDIATIQPAYEAYRHALARLLMP